MLIVQGNVLSYGTGAKGKWWGVLNVPSHPKTTHQRTGTMTTTTQPKPTLTDWMNFQVRYYALSTERKKNEDWLGSQVPVDIFYRDIDTGELNDRQDTN